MGKGAVIVGADASRESIRGLANSGRASSRQESTASMHHLTRGSGPQLVGRYPFPAI